MKKRRLLFYILMAVIIVMVIATIHVLYIMNYIPHKMYSNEHFGIKQYYSSVDKDLDGLDDQTDILNGARNYIATKPKYKSKYYSTGYSNDEYGVCTDVVAHALKNAGYDLMFLVAHDVEINSKMYESDVGDSKIDFRRVRNLKIYFENNAISLTTDIKQIDEWQGGDIVIFNKHVGIISDKRNKNGVPFVIHHNKISEKHNYEEDILEYRNDIVGHYRMS